MTELPKDFAIPLGRIMFLGGRVEHLLGQLIPAAPGNPAGLGLSGKQLVDAVRSTANTTPELERILVGYAEQMIWCNYLVHGSHDYANGTLWTWYVPLRGRGQSAQSFQFSLSQIQTLADSWQNLESAAHAEVHASAESRSGQ